MSCSMSLAPSTPENSPSGSLLRTCCSQALRTACMSSARPIPTTARMSPSLDCAANRIRLHYSRFWRAERSEARRCREAVPSGLPIQLTWQGRGDSVRRMKGLEFLVGKEVDIFNPHDTEEVDGLM